MCYNNFEYRIERLQSAQKKNIANNLPKTSLSI